ncbi:MAG: T9SS type A sorting domain-containing protein [Deltaproteobacteria bacterium]|nr:T9SS type A sorting domain-containing protein [Deltaproteobacteria bacterium]
MNSRYIETYRSKFEGKRLKATPSAAKLEGWFFGYPSCCVEQFIRKPYVPNRLEQGDQRILFHWACPGCQSTRSLLREYQGIYRECVRSFGGVAPERKMLESLAPNQKNRWYQAIHRPLPWAASLAALAFLPVFAGTLDIDPHILGSPDDQDGDGLSYMEEILLGGSPEMSDTDANGIADGIDESLVLYALIGALPRTPIPDGPYAEEWQMDGVEQCAVCGEWIDMGFIRIIHPERDLEVDIPYIGLHYLEHGGLAYDGSIHNGRVNIARLKEILFPYDPSHIIDGYIYEDEDSDRLENNEEPLLSTDPLLFDTDNDSVGDGFQIAGELTAALGGLPREPRNDGPYLIDHMLRGSETCTRCGRVMNMGWVEVVNPLENLSLELPYITLHYMAHGSFVYEGDVHPANRVIPSVVSTLIFGSGHGHQIPIGGDSDGDGLTDAEEEQLYFLANNPDTDSDGIMDGPDLAYFLHEFIGGLPEGPLPDQTYVINHLTYGIYECLVCGDIINMGSMEIVDPVHGKSTWVSYYNDHFLKHGSFSTDRPGLYTRLNVLELAEVIGVSITQAIDPMPSITLLLNTPNPFTTRTEISFSLTANSNAELMIFDVAGRKICDIYSGPIHEGSNRFFWGGRDSRGRSVPAGTYICKLSLGSFSLKRKIVKVR